MLSRLFKWVILALGVLLLVYMLVYFAREGTKVASYMVSGTVNSSVMTEADSFLFIIDLDTADFAIPVYPAVGDTILMVNDSSAITIDSSGAINRWYQNFNAPYEPGRSVPVEFLHSGVKYTTNVITRPPSGEDFIQILLIEIIRFLIALSFISVGLWAFLMRPDSSGVKALSLFCYSMGSFMIFSVSILSDRFAAFSIPLQSIFSGFFDLFDALFGAFWLNLQLLFPRPKNIVKEKPYLAYGLCYIPIIIILLIYLIFGFSSSIVSLLVVSGQIGAGFYILARSYNRAESHLEKRQTKLVLMGSSLGLIPFFILISVAFFFNRWFSRSDLTLLLINLCFLFMLLMPLSYGYAFQRYRLLEVEARLKRGTRYVLVVGLMLAALFGLVYLLGEVSLRQLGITSRTPTLIVALLLALGFTPAMRKALAFAERRFYPERQRLRAMIRDFLQRILTVPDRKSLWNQVESRLRETLKVEAVYPVLRSSDDSGFRLDREDEEITPFKPGQGLASALKFDPRPLLVDEAMASSRVSMTPEEVIWMRDRRIALLLPIVVQSQLVGFLGLGFKMGREDYSPEDLTILSSITTQAGLACENIRLLEENIEKKRLEEELGMARRIQLGFLPREIPNIPGLEIAALSRFCLEVAGDYYDVINCNKRQVVLAVGDVSGKGAGAALLMANLQASLRTAMGIGAELSQLVARINDLICQNTPPEQYITFFTGIFDQSSKRLTYVNAGHNPPLIFRSDGSVESLYTGGLILGFMPGTRYEQGEAELQSKDLLMMYTDGMSEAMNSAEEEFGEQRLIEYIQKNRGLPCENILAGLESEVMKFTQFEPLLDDFTLLIARIV